MDSSNPLNRYMRQMQLPEVGQSGQRQLARTRILVVGAGGLGSAVMPYLAGAGIGSITLVDPDNVEISNLHRQPIHRETDEGRPKVLSAADALRDLNSQVQIRPIADMLHPGNADQLIEQCDIVIDCADSFAASYILSDSCARAAKALVSASVLATSGYAGAYCADAPSLRAVFPEPPDDLRDCAEAGVMGPVVGVIGCLQAQMALAIALGIQESPMGRIISFDAQRFHFSSFCFRNAAEPSGGIFRFLAQDDISENDWVIDLRSPEEAPILAVPHARRAEVDHVGKRHCRPQAEQRAVLCCRSGSRAWAAARRLDACWDGTIGLMALGDQQRTRSVE